MEKHIPTIPIKPNERTKPPWMTGSVKKSVKRNTFFIRSFLNPEKNVTTNSTLKLEINATQLLKTLNRNETIKNDFKKCKSNPRYFWKYVQAKTKSNIGISPLKRENGDLAESNGDKAKNLNAFFASIFTEEDTK